MGGCFSVSLSCDQVVNQVCQCLCLKGSYIHNLPENLASLEKAMGALKAKRVDVQGRVDREEFTGHRRRLAQVQVWLTSVLTTENQYNELLNTSDVELKRLCLCRLCSKNVKKSYVYGKRVMVLLREVESLSSQREFDVVTEATPIAEVEQLPIQPTIIGQETMLEMVWNRLMEEERVGIVGLYGMGGVGKTTLLTKINNRFSETGGGFDVVIWVVVPRSTTVHKIQGSIGEKLGLHGKKWDKKSDMERSQDIHNVLRRKKFVLLLDDIWEKVNLTRIGVPYPNRVNQGYEVLGTLVRACLLSEDDRYESFVKMHDVVREMAMWIASDLGKHKERCIVQAGVGIREVPKVKNWKDVRRISLMENGIETIFDTHDCPELTTLILRENKLVEISDGFFQSMPKLLVYKLLEHIEYISVSISPRTLVGEKLFDDPKMGRCIQQVYIQERRDEKLLVLPASDGLRDIIIRDYGMLEEIRIEKTAWNKSLTSPCFSNISNVSIGECDGLKDLTWLLFAPKLTHLRLIELGQLEDIISKEKSASVLENERCNIIPFQKLEELTMIRLPELKSIYWNALPFRHLRRLYILEYCPKLRKLPLNSEASLTLQSWS